MYKRQAVAIAAVTRRRLNFIGMEIPPMPQGPLSVRKWHVEVPAVAGEDDCAGSDCGSGWKVASEQFTTLDREGLQEFALVPPIEAATVRVVCTENALAGSEEPWCDCIGLFQLRFA